MITVLVDARIDSHTGMGRYMRCTAAALQMHASADVRVNVLGRTGTPRYTDAEDQELLAAVERCRPDIIHLLDYRLPLDDAGTPTIATVHDVTRTLRPEYCDSDEQFEARFGSDILEQLKGRCAKLRWISRLPPGNLRHPRSHYEEYYGRMLMYSCTQASRIVTPTRTVAKQLAGVVGAGVSVATTPWGIDHASVDRQTGSSSTVRLPLEASQAYLLYVGQVRPHKGIPVLIDAYRRSAASRLGLKLVCVGRDFATARPGARLLAAELGPNGTSVGAIDDQSLQALYKGAAALVLPSEHEGFGFPPLEALAAGCTVIVSDIPVFRETLGDHAIFVDYADSASLAAAIDQVAISDGDDKSARAERMKWAARYTWKRHVDRLIETYRAVLGRQGRAG
jgi:glycosyltransferase involved in cell wall biosynthesis